MASSVTHLTELYRDLLLARECEERIRKDYYSDEMKTPVHLSIGAEGIAVGVCRALPKSTAYFGTYRNHAIYLATSHDSDGFFAELYGKATGCGKGKAGSMHLTAPDQGLIATSAVVATTIPLAVGSALAQKYQNKSDISCVFFGDGATEEGVFWESLNFAMLHKLPILFICEDNELAIHSLKKDRSSFHTLKPVIDGMGMRYATVNGWETDEIFETTAKIQEQMKTQGGPTFLHIPYFRFLEHVGTNEDFKAGYRSKPERAHDNFDPVLRLEKKLIEKGVTQSALQECKAAILKKIDASVEFAKKSPFPDASELFTDVYAEPLNTMDSETRAKFFPGARSVT